MCPHLPRQLRSIDVPDRFIVRTPAGYLGREGRKARAAAGIPVFGLDALSSAAYGPEAALALLIGLGAAGVAYILPITISIIVLLSIVYFSYRQTIEAYPNGGGSYTVAGQNLGSFAGLLAAAALMIDYVLTAAVGISAGVGALVSAVPQLRAAHAAALSGNPGDRDAGESARRARDGRGVSDSDLSFRGMPARHDRRRRRENAARGRTSGAGGAAAGIARRNGGGGRRGCC